MLELDKLAPNVKNLCEKLLDEGIDISDVIIGCCNPSIELSMGYSIQVDQNKYHFTWDGKWDYDYIFCTENLDDVIDAAKSFCPGKRAHPSAYIAVQGENDDKIVW